MMAVSWRARRWKRLSLQNLERASRGRPLEHQLSVSHIISSFLVMQPLFRLEHHSFKCGLPILSKGSTIFLCPSSYQGCQICVPLSERRRFILCSITPTLALLQSVELSFSLGYFLMWNFWPRRPTAPGLPHWKHLRSRTYTTAKWEILVLAQEDMRAYSCQAKQSFQVGTT